MKLIGKLKKQVEDANNKEEARDIIANAGMELTAEELEQVAGGYIRYDTHSSMQHLVFLEN